MAQHTNKGAKQMNGYRRNEDGTLDIVETHNVDGKLFAGTSPLSMTDRVVEVMGWPNNGTAWVYETEGGVEVLIPQSVHAVYVEGARCTGRGSDRYKRVNGITSDVRARITALEAEHGPLTILVDSHTRHQGQQYKQAIQTNAGPGRYDHRQINDNDFVIVATI